MSDGYIVKPVAKALHVLTVVGEAGRALSLAEVCQRVNIPKTTVFRYLQTLADDGFLRHDTASDRYGLGLRLWELGQRVATSSRLREVAVEPMQALRDRFDETVNLGVMDGHEIVYMEMAESTRSLRMHARLGGRDPVHCTSLGRAILAFLPDDAWSAHLPARLASRTGRSIASMPGLRKELFATRVRGYGIDDGENEEGARCIGAPIRNGAGDVVAAVSVSAPASRIGDEQMDEIAAAVMETALGISRLLGFRTDPPRP